MISYFPNPYSDELLYSQLARYYTKSGYMAYTYAAEELYVSKIVRPDMEFVNEFTPDALRMITRDRPMEDVVMKHTMFPYYGRFLLEKVVLTGACGTVPSVLTRTDRSMGKPTGIVPTR